MSDIQLENENKVELNPSEIVLHLKKLVVQK